MNNYLVKQFILVETCDGYAVQNEHSFTLLTNKQLAEFFTMLDSENRLNITEDYINDFFGVESEQVTEFMLKAQLIEKVQTKKAFAEIMLITNDETFATTCQFLTKDIAGEITTCFCKSIKRKIFELNTDNIKRNTLYFLVLNPFDYKDFIAINDRLRELNVYFLITFVYNSLFYMSNLHKKEWYNPCPKCFLANIEIALRAKSKVNSQPTFQTIVDLIYNKELSFKVSLPLRRDNIVTLLNEIINYKNFEINYLANRVTTINLQGQVEYDLCSHWELCDCFE